MRKISVSVIMSEYNSNPRHLRVAIQSILNQTFKDFELIIVDDGGDNSLAKIVANYRDDRIRIIENPSNQGLVYSLNKAINSASGEYLARMDTDDIAAPDRLEKQLHFLRAHPEYSVAGTRAIEFSEHRDEGILGKAGEKNSTNIASGDTLVHPSVMMRRSDILSVGGYPSYHRSEDLALWCELLIAGRRLYVMDDILLHYRVNSNDYSKRKLANRRGEISARLNYYPKMGVPPRAYLRIVKSITAGMLPANLIRRYRANFVLDRNFTTIYVSPESSGDLVSIIVPVHNTARYLDACLDSIVSQSYKNIEIVLIDDGSTDGSDTICDSYSERDSRVKVVHKKNAGVSDTRNVGIHLAAGKYITFVDSDDIASTTYIARMVSAATRHNADMVTSIETRTINDLGSTITNNPTLYSRDEALIALLYPSAISNGPVCKLIRTEYAKAISFDSSISIAEDLDYNYRLVSMLDKVVTIHEKLYFYRTNPDGAMLSSFQPKRMDGLKATMKIVDDTIKVNNPSLVRAAKTRHYMEAVLIAEQIDNHVYGNEYEKCLDVMKCYRGTVIFDSKAPILYRILASLSMLSIHASLRLVVLRTQIRNILNARQAKNTNIPMSNK